MECLFCMKPDGVSDIMSRDSRRTGQLAVRYECPRCGKIYLTREAYEDFSGIGFSPKQKGILSICLRNEYQKRSSTESYGEPLKRGDLIRLVETYREKDPIEKMGIALQLLDKNIKKHK